MDKKGQVGFFIILSLLLVIAVLFFFSPKNQQLQEEAPVQDYTRKSVTLFVQQCLAETLAEAVYTTSMQGGYFAVPEPFVDSLVRVPLYFYGSVYGSGKKVPSKEQIAREIEASVVARLPLCFKNFTAFKKQGVDVIEGPLEARVALGKTVSASLHFPLTIRNGEGAGGTDGVAVVAVAAEEFSAAFPANFDLVYAVVNETVAAQDRNPDFVPLGTVMALAEENNVSAEISYLADDVVVYSYTFSFPGAAENLTFLFGAQYGRAGVGAGVKRDRRDVDYALPFESRRCYVGDTCAFNLNAYSEPFTFEDATPLFDISPAGRVSFVPAPRAIGSHTIPITITSGASEKTVRFALDIREVPRE